MNLFTKQKQTRKHRSLWSPKRKGMEDKLRVGDYNIHTTIHKIDNQRPTVQHKELYSIVCNIYKGRESEKTICVYIYIYIYTGLYTYIAESLFCILETNKTIVNQLYFNKLFSLK